MTYDEAQVLSQLVSMAIFMALLVAAFIYAFRSSNKSTFEHVAKTAIDLDRIEKQ
ncbi:cbb3-type cytochrome c oxidase subunit 3 [Hyphomicrobium sp. 99]|uniref:cbb3-type cytochrome c oxidase subunit 3 n=1 Tax=Hyphomicrobium sp. 99 TaxID=1163419 RepID=UPI0005F893C9|nr:cbb3-type cytochrome c oxidase subunit 3 [Hyphomicrobium sp. 99]